MRDGLIAWLALLLLCGLLLPATIDRPEADPSVVTVTFVQAATAADPGDIATSPR